MNSRPDATLSRRQGLAGLGVLGVAALTGCSAPTATSGTTSPNSAAPKNPTPGTNQPIRIQYGPVPDEQFGDLFLPRHPTAGALPVLVCIHGGGWQGRATGGYMEQACRQLTDYGMAAWNIQYRGTGKGGGWPGTFEDVAAAVDTVADLPGHSPVPLDTNNVHVMGHSAGGQLAAWVASRPRLPLGTPGTAPRVTVRSCVAMAGVYDMKLAYKMGDPFMKPLLGGTPEQESTRYELASPIDHLPTGIPVVCLHGRNDHTVNVTQAETYGVAARAAGDPVDVLILPFSSHSSWLNISSPSWAVARHRIVSHVLHS